MGYNLTRKGVYVSFGYRRTVQRNGGNSRLVYPRTAKCPLLNIGVVLVNTTLGDSVSPLFHFLGSSFSSNIDRIVSRVFVLFPRASRSRV